MNIHVCCAIWYLYFNSLPNSKFLDWSKLKVFAYDRINVTKKLKSVFGWVEVIVVKEKILVTSIFSFSDNVFKRPLFQGRLKSFSKWLMLVKTL